MVTLKDLGVIREKNETHGGLYKISLSLNNLGSNESYKYP